MDIRCHFLCKGWSCHLRRLAFRCILLPHHSLPLNHLPLPFSLFFPLNFPFLPFDLPVPFSDRSGSLLGDLLLLVEGSRTASRCSGIPGGRGGNGRPATGVPTRWARAWLPASLLGALSAAASPPRVSIAESGATWFSFFCNLTFSRKLFQRLLTCVVRASAGFVPSFTAPEGRVRWAEPVPILSNP